MAIYLSKRLPPNEPEDSVYSNQHLECLILGLWQKRASELHLPDRAEATRCAGASERTSWFLCDSIEKS